MAAPPDGGGAGSEAQVIYILDNLTTILAATVAGLVVGQLWWSIAGGPEIARPRFLLTALLFEMWLCAILAGALILAPDKAGRWTMALGSAIVIWIGFVMPAIVVTHAYRGAPARVGALDSLRWLAVMLMQAVVLNWMGLVRPA